MSKEGKVTKEANYRFQLIIMIIYWRILGSVQTTFYENLCVCVWKLGRALIFQPI